MAPVLHRRRRMSHHLLPEEKSGDTAHRVGHRDRCQRLSLRSALRLAAPPSMPPLGILLRVQAEFYKQYEELILEHYYNMLTEVCDTASQPLLLFLLEPLPGAFAAPGRLDRPSTGRPARRCRCTSVTRPPCPARACVRYPTRRLARRIPALGRG
jgi:hypothetical protein